MKGIEFIEIIHYYLCYRPHSHFSKRDLEIFKRQSNVLYYTSRICRKLSKIFKVWSDDIKYITYFISYIFTIKYLLDIQMNYIFMLYRLFRVKINSLVQYELFFLEKIQYNFDFLCKTPSEWNIY